MFNLQAETKKFLVHAGLTQFQVDTAIEGTVVEKCLILKDYKYENKKFENRTDFEFIYAPSLSVVTDEQF